MTRIFWTTKGPSSGHWVMHYKRLIPPIIFHSFLHHYVLLTGRITARDTGNTQMKRILALILSGTFLTVFTVSGVFAQTETPAQTQTPAPADAQNKRASDSNAAKPMQGKMDKNDDGAVDLSEFTNMDRLKQADTNGDGTLSQDEIQAMVMKRIVERQARRMTNRLDVNGTRTFMGFSWICRIICSSSTVGILRTIEVAPSARRLMDSAIWFASIRMAESSSDMSASSKTVNGASLSGCCNT